jgi:enterochelin esterase-like enzyme
MLSTLRSFAMTCALAALALPGAAQSAEGGAGTPAAAAPATGTPPAANAAPTRVEPACRVDKVRVHGPSLEGNLAGDDATRDVYVYLPPGYCKGFKRYPVIYYLHGYGVTADVYKDTVLKIPADTDAAMTAGKPQFIIVMPDAFTKLGGSFYANSPVIGDWETFIAKDLVAWVDSKYRTIRKREGRGLAGHSMGGYGTLRVGMKYPEVFAAIHAASSPAFELAPNAETTQKELARMKPDMKAESRGTSFSNMAKSAAWAPNPQKPPFYFDLPFDADGKAVPLVPEKWAANSPLLLVEQNVPALKSFRGVALDVGNQDGLQAANTQLDAALTRLGVPHEYEIYEGTHGNRIGARFIEKVLPFFAKHLTR